MNNTKSEHAAFNKFQTMFYTDIKGLDNYTNYEFKLYSFRLLNNLTKGFPLLSVLISNVYSPEFIKFDECPSLIKALQRKFINGFSRVAVPKFIYYPSPKATKTKSTTPTKRKSKNKIDFEIDVKSQIQTILFYDNKTYEYLKYSKKVQELGNAITAEFNMKNIERFKSLQSKT